MVMAMAIATMQKNKETTATQPTVLQWADINDMMHKLTINPHIIN